MNRWVVIWSERAWQDLDAIHDFIAKISQIEAKRQIFRILDRADQLSTNPLSGPLQPLVNPKLKARYLVQDNYKVIYFVTNNTIVVSTVFDTRQDPRKLGSL